ncbi:MAG: FimV/HubP family polar landmark protein [Pseudomonadota bacterium]|nr:FimV/HubP family polar landmark protein [Pseudomonadota bacterium]
MKLHLTGWLLLIMLCGIVSDPVSAQTTPLRGPKNATDQFSGAVYGPIDSQDTLWRIANRYRQNQNLTIYQVMVAIYELNPDAFEQQNLNLMVDGATLNLPSDRYIARIDPTKARLKAEADDAAWARMEPRPGDSLNNLKPPVPLVNQDDLTQTKSELEQQLVQIDQSQARQFEELRNQFAASIDSVQALLDDNRKLYDRIEKINTDLESLRGRVDDEVETKVEEQLALQRELKEILLSDRAAKQAEQENSIAAMLTSPMALIAGTALLSLSFIAGLAVWLMKRKSSPAEPGVKLPEQPAPEVDESIADLSTAIESDIDDNELSDEELFNDDDLLDDVLSTELESSLNEDESFADLNDDMLVPDEGSDPFEEGDSELDQDELDSLFDDEFADDADDDAIDLSADDDLLDDFESEQQAADLGELNDVEDGESLAGEEDQTSDEELAALLEDPEQVYKTEENEEVSGDDIDDILADNAADDDFDIDDIDALLDAEQAPAPEPEPEIEPQSDIDELDESDDDIAAVPIESPVDDEDDDKPEISIDDLLEENQPTEEDKAALPVDDGPVSEEMLGKLDEEISQQSQALDRLTDSIISEIDQIEMMGDLAGDLDDEDLDEDVIDNQEQTDTEAESKLQSIDDITDDLDEINIDDIENADVFEDPLSDELLAELEAELPEDDELDVSPLPEAPADDVDESSFDEDVSDDLTDELLQELGEFEPEPDSEPDSESEAEVEVEDDFDDSQLDDPLTDELLAELDAELEDTDDLADSDQASADESEQDAVDTLDDAPENIEDDMPEDSLTDELLAELESSDDSEDELSEEVLLEEPAEDAHNNDAEALSDTLPETEDVTEDALESEAFDVESEPEADSISDIDPESDAEAENQADEADEAEEDLTKAILEELDELDRADALAEEQAEAQVDSTEPETNDLADEGLEDAESDVDDDALTGEAAFEKALADFDKQMMDDIPSFSEQAESGETPSDDGFDDDLLGQALDDFEKEIDSFELEQEQDGVLPDAASKEQRDSADIDELEDVPGLDDWLTEGSSGEEAAILDELDNSEFDELLGAIDSEEPEDKALEDFKLDNPDLDLQALFSEEATEAPASDVTDDTLTETDAEDSAESDNPIDASIEDDFVDVETLMAESDATEEDEAERELDLDVSLSEFSGVSDDDDVFDIDKDAGQNANLDLARVYIEMDDPEAAKELLEEVMDKGSDNQKAEAESLLKTLSA